MAHSASNLTSKSSNMYVLLRWWPVLRPILSCRDEMTIKTAACSSLGVDSSPWPFVCIGFQFPWENPCTSSAAELYASEWFHLQRRANGHWIRSLSLQVLLISWAGWLLPTTFQYHHLTRPWACISFMLSLILNLDQALPNWLRCLGQHSLGLVEIWESWWVARHWRVSTASLADLAGIAQSCYGLVFRSSLPCFRCCSAGDSEIALLGTFGRAGTCRSSPAEQDSVGFQFSHLCYWSPGFVRALLPVVHLTAIQNQILN